MFLLCLHFLEEIPVCDDFQLLKDKKDSTSNKEGLMLCQSIIQQEKISFTARIKKWKHEVALLQQEKKLPALVGICLPRLPQSPQRNNFYLILFEQKAAKQASYLTDFVTSANCIRSYFFKSWTVGMWPWKIKGVQVF